MKEYLTAIVFSIGLVCGAIPPVLYHLWDGLKQENTALIEGIKQEKQNVEIVTQYQELLSDVSTWYQHNPVRVRIPGNKDCPGGIAPNPESVIFTVGGYKGSIGSTVDQ
jgi:hypothetical protein